MSYWNHSVNLPLYPDPSMTSIQHFTIEKSSFNGENRPSGSESGSGPSISNETKTVAIVTVTIM